MYRANVDASLRKENAGIGYVIFKDDTPIYKCRKRTSCPHSTKLEYLAVLDLLKYINEIGIKNVQIYTDCENLTEQLKQIGSGRRSGRPIKDEVIRDIIYYLSVNSTVTIQWVPREQNNIAHILSREAMRGLENKEMFEPIEQIRKEHKTNETKMVVKFRPNLFMRCPSCGEHKAATEFPRYKDSKKNRKCNSCEHKLAMISHSFIKTKNTY